MLVVVSDKNRRFYYYLKNLNRLLVHYRNFLMPHLLARYFYENRSDKFFEFDKLNKNIDSVFFRVYACV